jgi:hypothetical protein
MTKKESMAILLACKKHHIHLTTRNEGEDYLAVFLDRLEVRSFDAAKLITNGLVIEGRLKKGSLNKPASEFYHLSGNLKSVAPKSKYRGPSDWSKRRMHEE